MSHLLLSHLSKDNNDPVLVETIFKNVAGDTFIEVASRNQETQLFYVSKTAIENATYSFNPAEYIPDQLNLF